MGTAARDKNRQEWRANISGGDGDGCLTLRPKAQEVVNLADGDELQFHVVRNTAIGPELVASWRLEADRGQREQRRRDASTRELHDCHQPTILFVQTPERRGAVLAGCSRLFHAKSR